VKLEKNKVVTTKLESENVKFRDGITKVEQEQLQNDNSTNNSSSKFTEQLPMVVHHEKPLADDTFGIGSKYPFPYPSKYLLSLGDVVWIGAVGAAYIQ
jgi:hypothetical protein